METTTSRNESASRIWRTGLLVMFMLGASCAPLGSAVKVEPSVPSLQVNDIALTSVKVENIADLIAFEMHLSFDANVLEVTELIDGGFIKPDFIVQKTFDNAAGTIDYAVAQIDRPPANGNGTLFEIVFRAKALGQSPIHFRETQAAPMGMLLSDSTGTAIQVSLINGSIDVSE
ncbi:MAG TPA: cohesin domain-containing protein [Anaerolineales bacterium]|nr:cohesin domain-containing protein [Anaerolineales bacterium]